jgi:hypothetical protein
LIAQVDDPRHLLGESFVLLHDSAGDLATVFPSAAPVEYDFSLGKWEK